MKHTLAYLGNELEAAGWRLAGALALTPDRGAEAAAFERARAEASLVLVSAAFARALPAPLLESALAALQPLVLVLPDDGGAPPFDPAERVRRQLGLEADAPPVAGAR
jgi:vacuolar-type H+-ATPase subunit F/Vma7